MSAPSDAAAEAKRRAAERACALIEPGMRVGLGTGSTAFFFVEALGRRVQTGLDVVGVPTSEATRVQAAGLGIPLATLDEIGELDITVDGADELDGRLRLVKGGGGALLREKLVASASRRMVVVADGAKRVATLGAFPLPVEVVPFGIGTTERRIAAIVGEGIRAVRRHRTDGAPFVTDGGNAVLDLHLGRIDDPEGIAAGLKSVTGVVEHGLFLGLASLALIGEESGVMELRP